MTAANHKHHRNDVLYDGWKEASYTYTPYDVLCGKDKTYNKHPGNQIFRNIILAFRGMYVKSSSKQGKMNITKYIVRKLQNEYGTRFLKPTHSITKCNDPCHPTQGYTDPWLLAWEEISDQMARDKVSHALRFASRAVSPKVFKRSSPFVQKIQSFRSEKMTKLSSAAFVPTPSLLVDETRLSSSSSSSTTSSKSSASASASTSTSSSLLLSSDPTGNESNGVDSGYSSENVIVDNMVESLFERQRRILASWNFDDHRKEDEFAVLRHHSFDNIYGSSSVIDQALYLQQRSDTALATSSSSRLHQSQHESMTHANETDDVHVIEIPPQTLRYCNNGTC